MRRPDDLQARVADGARAILESRIPILEGVFALLPLLHFDPSIVPEKSYNLLRGIASEMDDLPIGRVREEWHPDFLPEKDREIARCEALWREDILEACERIVTHLQIPGSG
jgi:hypothetical protein